MPACDFALRAISRCRTLWMTVHPSYAATCHLLTYHEPVSSCIFLKEPY